MSKINIEVRYPSHQDDARHYDENLVIDPGFLCV